MEASNVYFTSFKATEHENLLQKLHCLMKTAGFETIDFTDKYARSKSILNGRAALRMLLRLDLEVISIS